MALITKQPNYDLAGGLKYFEAAQLQKDSVSIQIKYDVTVAKVRLEMSTDDVDYDEIAGSSVDLDPADSTYTYRITNATPGMYVRLVAVEGTGTIDKFNILN